MQLYFTEQIRYIHGNKQFWLVAGFHVLGPTQHVRSYGDRTSAYSLINQRTNGPVNAHLRSAVYTNVIENSPSVGTDEALGPFFFQNNQYTVHTSFSLQMTL